MSIKPVLMKIAQFIKLSRKWWKTWRTMPVIPWIRAAQRYKSGRFREAAELYRAGLLRHASHPAVLCARLDLAFCLFKLGKLTEAEGELKLAVQQHPESRDAQLRLAQFQMWVGHPLQAAWTMRRALKALPFDQECIATFALAVLEGGAPDYLVKEAAQHLSNSLGTEGSTGNARASRKLAVAQARFMLEHGDAERGREELYRLTCEGSTSLEAITAYAELLIEDGKIPFARQQLRRGLLVAPNHPRVLSLLAESYVRPGQFQNPDYALQLATSSCQFTDWSSPRELHVLAEAYYVMGDKMAALLMASKAKQVGSRILSSYRKSRSLNQLIDELSSGTLA